MICRMSSSANVPLAMRTATRSCARSARVTDACSSCPLLIATISHCGHAPEQREVADQIEHLVAHRFVGPAQRLHRAIGRKDERVLEAAAARQAARAAAPRLRADSRTCARAAISSR